MRARVLLLAVVLPLGFAATADAEPILLAEIDLANSGGSSPFSQNSLVTDVYLFLGYEAPSGTGFLGLGIDPAVGTLKNWVGQSSGQFDFTAANDPGFGGVVAALTDGVDTILWRYVAVQVNSGFGAAGGGGIYEPNLSGASIDFIRLVVDDLTYGLSASSVFPGELKLDYAVSGTWQVYGTPASEPVPEPSTLILLSIGFVSLIRVGRRCGRG